MRLVLDASVLVELLVLSPRGQRVAERLRRPPDADLHLPHLADVETVSVLRAHVRASRLRPERAAQAVTDLRDFPARRWPAEPLLDRIWQLRENVTAYDATYLALTEALDGELLTADGRLARAARDLARCSVTLID